MKIVIILLLLPLALLVVPASHAQPAVTVTISGLVSNLTFGSVTVRAHASETASSLSGGGTDSPPFLGVSGNPAACQFPLTGSVSGSVVTLSGTVTQSSVASFIGSSVSIVAESSGAITFTFAGIVFTGTGTVVITTV